MRFIKEEPSNQGHKKICYVFKANADEWNLIRDAMNYLVRRTPNYFKEFSSVRSRAKQIGREVFENVPESKKRELYDTTENKQSN